MRNLLYLQKVQATLFAPLYIMVVAAVAVLTGVEFVLFPELGALAHDVFKRPDGRWARAPWMLILTPLLAAVVGLLCSRHFPFGILSVLLCTLGSIAIVVLLRSPITPAISAGLLPLVFGIQSWWYPPAILFGTALLALLSLVQRRWVSRNSGNPEPANRDQADNDIENTSRQYAWVPFFTIFLLIATFLAIETGWRAVLVPPLVVMGYEMFAHADHCPWVNRPLILPLACVLTASGGVLFSIALGGGVLAAGGAVIFGILVLRGLELHIPPAIAIGLIPLLIDSGGAYYPLAVGLGTSVLTASFMAYRSFAGEALISEGTGEAP
jgi:HPP family